MSKVTIITGYYNRVDHLKITLDSILNQTFRDFEFIVFDDASTDGTGNKLDQLERIYRDPRLRIIKHKQNMGFTRGMVNAISASTGEFIAIQGSGDFSLPDRIEKQVLHLDQHADVVAVGSWYTNVVADTGARRPRQPNANDMSFEKLLAGNVFSHGEVMMRRSAYDAAGGYRVAFKNCQDYDLWLRLIRLGNFSTIPEHLYDRYVRMDGVSYDPIKFTNQARFFLLAQRIAQMDSFSAAKAIEELLQNGPSSLVPLDDPGLQDRYVKASLRSIVWGASSEAEELANLAVENKVKKLAIIALARMLKAPGGRTIRWFVQRAFGVR